jgi:hypothetical protein
MFVPSARCSAFCMKIENEIIPVTSFNTRFKLKHALLHVRLEISRMKKET